MSEDDYWRDLSRPLRLQPGLLTHLTRLTRLCICGQLRLPNDPAALPSAGGGLRVLELPRLSLCDPTWAPIEALLPVAAGLEALDINDLWLTPADAARLAAALPRGIARLHFAPRIFRQPGADGAWAALPVTSLELERPPADLSLLAGASRLERLSVDMVSRASAAALVAALRALPRLRVLQLGMDFGHLFAGDQQARAPGAFDAFVAAAVGLRSLRELRVSGCPLGGNAKSALVEAAPRLSALRLAHCGLSDGEAAGLAARLRAAAGRNALSLEVCAGAV
jgi:hypothetical protein